jgi:hypothetical protein
LEYLDNLEEFKILENANNYFNDFKQDFKCEISKDEYELGFVKVGKFQVFDSFHPDDLIQPIDASSIYN